MKTVDPAALGSKKPSVFALFSDKSAQRLLIDVYDKPGGERISSRSTIKNTPIRQSAECGFSCALNLFEQKLERTNNNFEIVWEFGGNAYEANNYDGLSAGLAFFSYFMIHLLGAYCRRPPRRFFNGSAFSIGATGVLSGATSEARVEKVAHIADKLRAAARVLRPGDKLLYPLGNREEISAEIASTFAAKGIELVPVATAVEAANHLIKWFISGKKHPCIEMLMHCLQVLKKAMKSRLAWAGIGLAGLLLLYLLICPSFLCTTENMLAALEYGEFDKVLLCIDAQSSDPEMAALQRRMHTPLLITSSFVYLQGDQPLLQDADAHSVMQNVVIDSSMGYRFEFQVQDTCYFYLFQFADDSTVDLLFPGPDFELENHLLPNNQLFMIPGGINYFYFTDHCPRRLVTLYFLGTFWRARDIEELYADYSKSRNPIEMKQYRDRMIKRIQRRSRALQKGLRGIYYQQNFFWRQ